MFKERLHRDVLAGKVRKPCSAVGFLASIAQLLKRVICEVGRSFRLRPCSAGRLLRSQRQPLGALLALVLALSLMRKFGYGVVTPALDKSMWLESQLG